MSYPLNHLAVQRLGRIVESSDDAIVSKDLNGIITSWNGAAERMFGYTAAEAVGQSIRIIIPADRQSEEDFVLGEIREGRSIRHYETIRQRKDGTQIPISLTVSPLYDDDNKTVVGASKIARDITEHVRLRGLAEEQAAIAKQLGDFGATVAATLDKDTVIQKVTDTATQLTKAEFGVFFYNGMDRQSGPSLQVHTVSGISKEAFASFPQPRVTELFGPTFRGEGIVRLDDVTKDPRYGRNIPYYGMPEGHLPVRSYLAVPVKTASGQVLGGLFFAHSRIGVFTEQSEQIATGIAAWAGVALQNAQLYFDLRETDRVKDEFLAILSHELRTPLTAMLGYSRMLRGGLITGEKADRGLEVLERNARSLGQIVDDVLDISRIVTGKLRLDVQTVELPIVVHNAISSAQPAADSRQIRLETIVDPRVGPVSGDPDRLQQVVWNLLSNAVKFTPKGGRVQVRVERVNSHVEIVVSDTGAGIRTDFLPYVFERFRQADSSMTRRTGGLGLGLSIVRNIVEMHGGSVQVESAGEGLGSTFRVRLPLMIVHASPAVQPREHPLTERTVPLTGLMDLTDVHVVAIDDEPDARNLLRSVLEAAGAEVVTLSTAVGALDQLAQLQPDVLVVDLGMPEMDGFEFITRVRTSSDPGVREIPAAALTAFARSEDRTKALRSGFEMHLAKPVDPGELAASVATLFRRGRH